MDLVSAILLTNFVIHLGLALHVLWRDPASLLNRSVAYFSGSIALWGMGAYGMWQAEPEQVLGWTRFAFVGPAFIPWSFLNFVGQFTRSVTLQKMARGLLPLSWVFAAAAPTTFLLRGLEGPFLNGPQYGFLYPILVATVVGAAISGFAILWEKFQTARGRYRVQLSYLLWGVGLTSPLALTFTVIPPLIGHASWSLAGPPSTLILAFFMFRAMARFQMLKIQDFLSRVSVSIGLVVLAVIAAVGLWTHDSRFVTYMTIVVANAMLGGYVFFRHIGRSVNQAFLGLSVSLAAWAFCIFQVYSHLYTPTALVWLRGAFGAMTWFSAAFFLFAFSFPRNRVPARPALISLFSLGLLLSAMSLTPAIVADMTFNDGGYRAVYGPGYYLFAGWTVALVAGSLALLWAKYTKTMGLDRFQIRTVLIGFAISVAWGLTTNLTLPLLGNNRWSWMGPLSSIFLLGSMTYAIYRFDAMGAAWRLPSSALAWLRFAQWRTRDKIFDAVSRRLPKILRQEELARVVVKAAVELTSASEVAFLLYNSDRKRFVGVSPETMGDDPVLRRSCKKVELDENNDLVAVILKSRSALVQEDLERHKEILYQSHKQLAWGYRLHKALDVMASTGFSVWVPVVHHDDTLAGLIALGFPFGRTSLPGREMRWMVSLATQLGLVLDNVHLYEEIRALKSHQDDILSTLAEGVVSVDSAGRIVRMNRAAGEIIGLVPAQCEGRSVTQIWKSDDWIPRLVREVEQLKEVFYQEVRLPRASGESVPVNLWGTLLNQKDRSPMVFIAISDLSRIKTLEHQLRQSDKLAALGTMAAGMAHEIKNPLSSLKVFSQLIIHRWEDAEFRDKFKSIVPAEIEKLNRIVDDLLGFARTTELNVSCLRLSDVIAESLEKVSLPARERRIQTRIDVDHNIMIEADARQLSHVFINLFLNAVEAMTVGGILTVTARRPSDNRVEVAVNDTGGGIRGEWLPKLFDPFFTTKHGGTGLGLAIAHRIVEAHGGTIHVASEIGRGATFTVSLPMIPIAAAVTEVSV